MVCERSGKRCYGSKRVAIQASAGMRNAIRAYLCPECHRWHVTHKGRRDAI